MATRRGWVPVLRIALAAVFVVCSMTLVHGDAPGSSACAEQGSSQTDFVSEAGWLDLLTSDGAMASIDERKLPEQSEGEGLQIVAPASKSCMTCTMTTLCPKVLGCTRSCVAGCCVYNCG